MTSSGVLHIVADERHLLDAIDALDLQRARLLARLSDFWNQQAQCAFGNSGCCLDRLVLALL